MKIDLSAAAPLKQSADLLIVTVFEGELPKGKSTGTLGEVDRALSGLISTAAADERFKGAAESSLQLHGSGKLAAKRVTIVGLGKRERFNAEVLRQASGRAVKLARQSSARKVVFSLPGQLDVAAEVRAAAEGALLGAYRFERYRTKSKERKPDLEELVLASSAAPSASARRELELALEVAASVNWARDLVNEPAGVLTPKRLAAEARAMARARGLKIEVLGRAQIERLKMGMFLGVAQGSVEEPQLIHLSYTPRGGAKKAGLALIGKAITFDSGGLSLKTNEGMMDMKTDMAGSAAVLGAMRVMAHLKPPFAIDAYMGACENMPSGTAYKLGDVLRARNGKTVEITNTDAEGRLVLGDVLAWANEKKPAAMIDLATLTGACIVALGHWTVGAFGTNDALTYDLLAAARRAGEDFWQLPMTEWVKDTLKSDIADMRNSGERWGGAIAAAHFLREFVGETPWVHLDIAGPSFSARDRGYIPKGGTGVAVRTLVEWIRERADTR